MQSALAVKLTYAAYMTLFSSIRQDLQFYEKLYYRAILIARTF